MIQDGTAKHLQDRARDMGLRMILVVDGKRICSFDITDSDGTGIFSTGNEMRAWGFLDGWKAAKETRK